MRAEKEDKTKKKKLSTGGKTAREKMMDRKKDLEKRSAGGGFIFPKVGTTRLRLKSPGDDEELAIEVIQFYLGKELGGVVSPATFDEPCPFMDKYKELKDSDDDDDKALAKRLVPKRKYAIGCDSYKDEKGKEVDQTDKAVLVARGAYQDITELYLDEDEWGDMTDKKEGYDIKIIRTGVGQLDTSYSVSPCQKKALPKDRSNTCDLEKIVRSQIPSFEELEDTLAKFLNSGEDGDAPAKKPKDSKSRDKFKEGLKDKKKKKRVRDI